VCVCVGGGVVGGELDQMYHEVIILEGVGSQHLFGYEEGPLLHCSEH
jgi:hypothetical protein